MTVLVRISSKLLHRQTRHVDIRKSLVRKHQKKKKQLEELGIDKKKIVKGMLKKNHAKVWI
jgi:hypothetical protein